MSHLSAFSNIARPQRPPGLHLFFYKDCFYNFFLNSWKRSMPLWLSVGGFQKTGCVSLYFFLERWCNTCFMFYPEQSNSRTRRQTSADLLKNGQLHSVTHSRISSLLMVFLSTFNLLGVIFTLYEIIDDKTKLSFQVLKTSDATTCCGHKNTMGDNNKKHMCNTLK